MYRNFFLFEKQTEYLDAQIRGASIVQAFTFRKNELTLHLENPENYLHISIDLNFPLLLSGQTFNVRKPKFMVFEQLEKQTIQELKIVPFDKRVQLLTDDFVIEMIFYGREPNIFIFDKEGQLLDSFKEKPWEEPLTQKKQMDFRHLQSYSFLTAIQSEPGQKLDFFLRRHFYAFNKTLIKETVFRLSVSAETSLRDLSPEKTDRLQEILAEIGQQMAKGKSYLYYEQKSCTTLSLFPLRHKEEQPDVSFETYDELNRAWWKFISLKRDTDALQRLIKKCESGIKKRLSYIQRSLQKLEQAEDLHVRKEEAELKGNLLLTFKTQIANGSSEAVLEDIFSGSGKSIRIKLNPAKSVAQNAEQYFNKYKNIDEKKEIIQIKKDTLHSEMAHITALKQKLESRSRAQIQKVHDELEAMKVLQRKTGSAGNAKSLQYAFRRRILDNEWDVYIGKNGPNNDLLTFEFAGKRDLWLHAQGVPGSHVIIRLPRKDVHPPQKVIEQAAQIAAANSKAQFSATVPVILTEVRYVSRIRKALPGTVSVRNEKVLFVKPLNF